MGPAERLVAAVVFVGRTSWDALLEEAVASGRTAMGGCESGACGLLLDAYMLVSAVLGDNPVTSEPR